MTTILRRSSSWNPGELTSLAWWAKADDGLFANYQGTLPIIADDPVGYLRDWSGNGMHGIQGTGAWTSTTSGADSARPTFKEDILGTMPGVLFDGADYLNLQESLFNGATEYTVGCLFSASAVSTASKRGMGVTGSGKIWSIGTNNASSWLQGDNNFFGSSEVADSASGTNFAFSARPLKTAMLVIIRAKQGVGAEIWVNGRLVGTSTWTSSAMATDQIVLLGTQNNTTSSTVINAVTASGWPAYWHEGFACSGRKVSDAELDRIHRYFFRKWPGNYPHRKSGDINLPASGHLQGVASDGTNWYGFHTSAIAKYNSSWSLTSSNTSLFGSIAGANHCGDGDYYGGYLYAPIGNTGDTSRVIARYDASTLAFVDSNFAATDTKGHPPALAVVPEHNAIIIPSFNTDDAVIWRYKLSDLSYVGTISLSSPLTGVQGICWDGSRLRFHSTTTKVYSCKFDGSDMREDFDSYGTPQGLGYDFTTDKFQICQQSGSADHVVEMQRMFLG